MRFSDDNRRYENHLNCHFRTILGSVQAIFSVQLQGNCFPSTIHVRLAEITFKTCLTPSKSKEPNLI